MISKDTESRQLYYSRYIVIGKRFFPLFITSVQQRTKKYGFCHSINHIVTIFETFRTKFGVRRFMIPTSSFFAHEQAQYYERSSTKERNCFHLPSSMFSARINMLSVRCLQTIPLQQYFLQNRYPVRICFPSF